MVELMNITHRWKSPMHTAMILFLICLLPSFGFALSTTMSRGQTLPPATLVGADQVAVDLSQLKGRVKIVSIVPQLNTPVCDEQTHRFSENNDGLDQHLEIVTISTNTSDDQTVFAKKARMTNVTFLSDAPAYDFGNKTGLLHPMHQILQRAVLVVDEQNVIRHLEIVPMSQLPNFQAAFDAARRVLQLTK